MMSVYKDSDDNAANGGGGESPCSIDSLNKKAKINTKRKEMPINYLTVYFLGLLKGIFIREAKGESLCMNEGSLVQRLTQTGIDLPALDIIILEISSEL
jgi:hypothetical protein